MKKSFYQIDQKQLAEDLQTNLKQGLAVQEAKQRFEKNGANTLTAKKKKSLFAKFVDQFKVLMIGILLAAAFVAALTGEQTDALFILAIVIINAIFGVFQESKSENAIDALKKMATPKATVIRGGQPEQVPATDLEVGDLVSLEAGDIVPADLRLVDVANLRVEEAALTGESVPVEKTDKTLTEDKLPLGDQDNLAFMNAHVVYGRALG
nr:HAD-IC family P-type ATPase [Serratia marcescens]